MEEAQSRANGVEALAPQVERNAVFRPPSEMEPEDLRHAASVPAFGQHSNGDQAAHLFARLPLLADEARQERKNIRSHRL